MKRTLLTLAAIAIALVSCNKQEAPKGPVADGTPVQFTASLFEPIVLKSTVDNPFDLDGEVGIFSGTPINAANVAYKVSSLPTTTPAAAGALVAVNDDETILWGQGQTAATTFYAYQPYSAANTDMTAIAIAVENDQHTLANLNKSDFMSATAANVAVKADAALQFSHKLSKVIVKVENKLAQDITKVEIKNVKKTAGIDLTTGVVTATAAEEATQVIQAYAEEGTVVETDANSVNHTYHVFDAIIVPQSAQPQIIVTVGANTTYRFALSSSFSFASGQKATATLVLESASASEDAASFSFTVGEWGANTDMSYGAGQKEITNPDQWSVIGNIMGTSWNQDFYMVTNPDNADEVMVTIKYRKDEEFKLRFGSAWKDETHTDAKYVQAGAQNSTALSYSDPNNSHDLWGEGNQNIKIDVGESVEEHTFTLYFKPEGYKLHIVEITD